MLDNPLADTHVTGDLADPNFDADLLDDRLFDTLAQLDIQDGGTGQEKAAGNDQAGTHKSMSLSPAVDVSSGKPPSLKKQPKLLSQQEFDNLWDGICATLPADN